MARREVETVIVELLAAGPVFTSADLVGRTGLTRQALHRHLVRAVEEGWLVREGAGRGTCYRSSGPAVFDRTWPTAGLEEDATWSELAAWLAEHLPPLSAGASSILGYAVTELVNNAIDHSEADEVRLRVELEGEALRAMVEDVGLGALETIRSRLALEDHLHALQELSKGKTTTPPERHSGGGIFFTSKMVERFELEANGLAWLVDNERADQTVREAEPEPGTRVLLHLDTKTRSTPLETFERYMHDFEFDTPRCVLRLFEYGTEFLSRSEARRLLANLDRFREVILDCRGVESVGQGFVDEVFRVWARAHPEVRLVPVEMGRAVEFMVRRGLSRAGEP